MDWDKKEYFNTYHARQMKAKETLAKIQVYLDAHFATVSNELWRTGKINYGYVGDITEVNRILKDVLVCLTGEGIE